MDGTARIAAERGILVVHHDRNYGYAKALQSAREFALAEGYQELVLCDADGQHEPRDIGKIIEALVDKKADYVIASRELGSAPHGDPFIHKYGRKLYSALVSLWFYPVFRTSITDSSSGFKGWSRRAMGLFDEIYRTTNRLHDGRINDLEELFIVARKPAQDPGGAGALLQASGRLLEDLRRLRHLRVPYQSQGHLLRRFFLAESVHPDYPEEHLSIKPKGVRHEVHHRF